MSNKIIAKELLKDKFWIVEDEGVRIGTLSINEDQYMLSDITGTRFFKNKKQLKTTLGTNLVWNTLEQTKKSLEEKEVYNYPTKFVPFNPMYDIQRKLPLFTKSEKSKSVYCAGYYIIKFDKGWVKSFCPKLITVERYGYRGPFKTEIEMRQELSRANSE